MDDCSYRLIASTTRLSQVRPTLPIRHCCHIAKAELPQTLATSTLSKNATGPQRPIAVIYMCAQLHSRQPSRRLVGLGRLELPTSPLSGVRSNHLSYRPGQMSEHSRQPTQGRLSSDICPQIIPLSAVLWLVELIGIEPMTPCLQSRCSPS